MIKDIKYTINNYDNKVYVNLNDEAYEVINNDLKYFENKFSTKSAFLNNIISAYTPYSKANPILYIENKLRELEEIFPSDEYNNLDLERAAINAWNSHYDNVISKRLNTKGKFSISFRLANSNLGTLNVVDIDDFTINDPKVRSYLDSLGLYIKNIFYEYSILPYAYREAIAYSQTISLLNNIIMENTMYPKNSKAIAIDSKKNKFIVKPYKIIYDLSINHTYLLGLSKKIDSTDDYIPATFRISKITKLKKLLDRPSGKITQAELKRLNEAMENNGLHYLIGKPQKIKLELTLEGYEKFKDQVNLRSNPTSIEKYNDQAVLSFFTTPHQIITYFFSFGKNVRILEPLWLKNKFIELYDDALMAYREKK